MQTQARKVVTKIEANPLLCKHKNENALLRVAAYCRVSTDSDDQLESYKAQVAYYTDAIAKNPHWRFVDIYADEGISGTLASKRNAFMRMMRDCDKGKIDLILTKSVARFARNTIDSLRYVRKLKAQGVGVYFEEQCLDSLKADSEMFIGLHSVLAQAESENISANVRWGIQQRMMSGTFAFRYNLMGYRKGEDGLPEIEPEGAECIRRIYAMYLEGKSLDQIKEDLEKDGIRTFTGKREWSKANLKNILTNERYSGDMLLQKTYTENCITKKVKKNRGEMTKYLITNNHPAIIDKDTYKLVQMEIARRGNKRKTAEKSITAQGKYSGKYALTEVLICGECGSPYRRRTWTINGEKKVVWRCLSRVENGTKFCKESMSIEEGKLHSAICRALNNAIANRQDAIDLILSSLSYAITEEDDTLEIYAMEKQLHELNEHLDLTVKTSLQSDGDPQKFREAIIGYNDQIMALRKQIELMRVKISSDERVNMEVERIRKILSDKNRQFNQYNDTYVRYLVEYIRVMSNGTIIIVLKGGIQLEETL